MTQPQYGYPPQGGYPDPYAQQQAHATPFQQPYGGTGPGYAPQQPYAPQGYAPQGYAPAPQYGQPPAPPVQDLSGDLDSFYAQRNVSGGKGISWKGVPDGYTIQGVVARKITNGDVFKETYPPNSPQAGQIRTNRDGSAKYAMQVPMKLHLLDQFQARDYPEAEARLFLRGGLRDEVTRAMAEVGAPEGPPEAGAFMRVTLTHRKPGNNIATNVFSVLYRSPGTWENDPSLQQFQQAPMAPPQPAPAGQVYGGAPQGPYQQAPAQYAAPQAAPNPQQYAAPQYGQPAYDPNQYQQPYGIGAKGYDPVGDAAQGNGPLAAPQYAPNPQASAFTQMAAAQGAVPDPAQMQAQYAQNTQAAPNPQQAPSQPQLPYGGQPQQAPAPPQPPAPPVQAGVQQSALDPNKQALLASLQARQQAPAGQPQG